MRKPNKRHRYHCGMHALHGFLRTIEPMTIQSFQRQSVELRDGGGAGDVRLYRQAYVHADGQVLSSFRPCGNDKRRLSTVACEPKLRSEHLQGSSKQFDRDIEFNTSAGQLRRKFVGRAHAYTTMSMPSIARCFVTTYRLERGEIARDGTQRVTSVTTVPRGPARPVPPPTNLYVTSALFLTGEN